MSTYRRHALVHGAQAFVIAVPAILALLTLSIVLPLVVLVAAELSVLLALPRVSWFRAEIDERIERSARIHASASRARLLGRMSPEHRSELEYLERLGAQIRERGEAFDDGSDTVVDGWLGLERLLALYVRLAIAHRASADSFRAVDRTQLDAHIGKLRALQEVASDPSREWIDRRLAILQRRAEAWDRARIEQELLTHQLATIGELVRWMHEQCATSQTESVRVELEDMLASWEQNGTTLHELSTLCDNGEEIDPRVLELGREPLPAPEPLQVGGAAAI